MRVIIEGKQCKIIEGDWVETKSFGNCQFVMKVGDNSIKVLNNVCTELTIPESEIISLAVFPFNTGFDFAMKELSKNGITKPRMSLIPQLAIVKVANVFGYGAEKYELYNFSKGAKNTTYTDAALRHINRYLLNEDVDDESGMEHLAHAVSCLLMCLDNDLNGTTIEDRNQTYRGDDQL